ncbi:MAG TPA: non-homologous end-joining DNA ligase [Nocardioides sp.]
MPAPLRPMLATRGEVVPTGDDWLHEVKWDGMRILAHLDGEGGLRLESRAGNVVTPAYPELRGLVDAFAGRSAVVDGEVVVLVDGRPSFTALAERIHERRTARAAARAAAQPVTFVVFDLLALDGRDLTARPLERRQRRLTSVLDVDDAAHWTQSTTYDDGPTLLAETDRLGLEGIVSKRRDAPYRPGIRSRDWLKFPHRRRESYVVGGWRPESGSSSGRIGALLVGTPTPDGLLYRGRVGSGIGGRTGRDLRALLDPSTRATSPFDDDVPREDALGTTWVEPTVVVDVEALGLNGVPGSSGARLRQPTYRGVRSDLGAEDLWTSP